MLADAPLPDARPLADDALAAARLRPWLTWPAWIACGGLLLLAPLFPALAVRWQFVPFAVGLVLLGLPHGAMDHLAGPHLRHRPLTMGGLAQFIAAYLAVTLLYLTGWRLYPPAALAVFLVLSWLHWGQGDYAYQRLFEGRAPARVPGGVLLIWLVRGGLPIVLPALAFPQTFAGVGAGLTQWYGGRGFGAPSPGIAQGGLALLLALTGLALWQAWREDTTDGRRGFWRDAGETVLLLAFFWRVPPLLAVGTYFCLWHSARHIGRLMLADPVTAGALAGNRLGAAVGRTVLQSLPMTLGAVALLVGLYAVQRAHGDVTLPGMVYLYLSLIAALTLPHFLVVLWMDRRQRV